MASAALAAFIGMEQPMLIDTIRAQCFSKTKKVGDHYEQIEVTDFQVAAFISIAVEMKVNPLLPGMLYAYPIKGGGIVPIMGPDGVFKKLAEHPDIASWEVEVFPTEPNLPPTHAIARIYRKGVERPIIYTAALNEWKIGENPNWVTRPRHMLQLRALKHAARQVIHGLPYDEDDRHIMDEVIQVSPGAPGQEPAPARPDPAALKRRKSGTSASAKKEEPPIEAEIVPPAKQTATGTTTAPEAAATDPCSVAPALKHDEVVTVKGVTIKSAAYENFGSDEKPRHGCKAEITGPYVGTVYDMAGGVGARANAEGASPAQVNTNWKHKGTVTLTLTGRFSKVMKLIVARVEEIKPDEAKQEIDI